MCWAWGDAGVLEELADGGFGVAGEEGDVGGGEADVDVEGGGEAGGLEFGKRVGRSLGLGTLQTVEPTRRRNPL